MQHGSRGIEHGQPDGRPETDKRHRARPAGPQDVPRACPECHPDADLTFPLGDRVRERAVDAEECDRHGENAEPGRHSRQEVLGPERVPDVFRQCAHLVERQPRLEVPERLADRFDKFLRANAGPHVQHEVLPSPGGPAVIHDRRYPLSQGSVLCVTDNADDFEFRLGRFVGRKPKPSSDRIRGREETLGEGAVDYDGHWFLLWLVGPKDAAGERPDPHGLEVFRRDVMNAGVQGLAGCRLLAGGRHRGDHSRAPHVCHSHRLYSRHRLNPSDQACDELPGLFLGIAKHPGISREGHDVVAVEPRIERAELMQGRQEQRRGCDE